MPRDWMQRCDTCRFYDDENYECRRNPPVFVNVPDPDGGADYQVLFPDTEPEGWCGEWCRDEAKEQTLLQETTDE